MRLHTRSGGFLALVAALGCNAAPTSDLSDDGTLDEIWVGEQQKLTVADTTPGDGFGSVLAISGDTALVGAPGKGSARVFARSADGWLEEAEIAPADIEQNDGFGYSVAISGDTALIGAWDSSESLASVYVFVRSSRKWSEQARLVASDGEPNDRFAMALAISGDRALVGAWGDSAGSGSAYMFVRNGTEWSQEAKLSAPDEAGQGEKFGSAVALDGDTALVGAPDDYFYSNFSGSAYLFMRDDEDGWQPHVQLYANDGESFDQFGRAVALSGDTALIGAYGDDKYLGSAYVFERGHDETGAELWKPTKLVASDGSEGDRFGLSVALSGDMALVGADLRDEGLEVDSGAAYVFLRTDGTWTEEIIERARDGQYGDHFGYPVALSGITALVGTTPEVDRVPGKGVAYVFDVARDTDEDNVIDTLDNCPSVPNSDQANLDGDELGDLCDVDVDGDGKPNSADNCREVPNPDQKNHDADTLGDACDDDDDGDGVPDAADNCVFTDNANQTDEDDNGVGDACEDLDGDGVSALLDNCPDQHNPGQEDEDGNGVGDICDDLDADGVMGAADNCPNDKNPGQEDLDADGTGDACDSDFDGDGVLNEDDNCPRTPNPDQADVCETPYGCSAAAGSGAPPLWMLGLLALAFRRRRRRSAPL